jgi:hypothetical protein
VERRVALEAGIGAPRVVRAVLACVPTAGREVEASGEGDLVVDHHELFVV